MREISAACRAGTDCGRCVKTISAMIPRDDTRACDGCTKRCGRICRADRAPSVEAVEPHGDRLDLAIAQVGPMASPLISLPLTVVSGDADVQVA